MQYTAPEQGENPPVYVIHSVEKPFCHDFSCACHKHQRQVAALLTLVNAGHLTLREAANLEVKP